MASPNDVGTLRELIVRRAELHPQAPAITARDRLPLRYADLRALTDRTASVLVGWGCTGATRVGVVMPHGADMATACLAVAAHCTAVPLNPAYTEAELVALMRRLGVSILLVAGPQAEARAAARALGLAVVEVESAPRRRAGDFELRASGAPAPSGTPQVPGARQDGVALVLHTSGSTAEPKIVPLTHRNLLESARNVARSLTLGPDDVCLSAMPLFHIGALVDLLIAPLSVGGCVAVAPGMGAADFFASLHELRPTWYQGVPTMLSDILRHAESHGLDLSRSGLRLLRSVSAPLPEATLHELEDRCQAPVIEIYGMTETAGVITSNPLPPGQRRVGSVGRAVGPEVLVVDGAGNVAPTGATGEVLVRGPSVMSGYELEPGVLDDSVGSGWLRTGDEGHLDGDGYLYLTGRIKDIINRGGEKIAPREIDEVAVGYPGVLEAAAFAVSHATLGEDVALAVVPVPGRDLDTQGLRTFLCGRLARFKVPREIFVCGSLPRAPGGKLQRGRLADWCAAGEGGGSSGTDAAAPASERQALLVRLWQEVLDTSPVGVDEDFVDLGGDSLRAVDLASRMSDALGIEVPAALLYDHPTVAALDAALGAGSGPAPEPKAATDEAEDPMLSEVRQLVATWDGRRASADSLLVGWNTMGSRIPLFWGVQGFGELRQVAEGLGPDQPVWGMRSLYETRHKSAANVVELARRYREEIERIRPEGPLLLGGYCAGGGMAREVARQLIGKGRDVASLCLVEHFQPGPYDGRLAYFFGVESGWHPFRSEAPDWLDPGSGRVSLHPSRADHLDVLADPHLLRRLGAELADAARQAVETPREPPQCEVEGRLPRALTSRAVHGLELELVHPGGAAWPAGTTLFSRWARPGSGRMLFDGAVSLAREVGPGERISVRLQVRAPLAPGPWVLALQLVSGGDWRSGTNGIAHRAIMSVLPGAAVWSYLRDRLPGRTALSLALRRLTGRTA